VKRYEDLNSIADGYNVYNVKILDARAKFVSRSASLSLSNSSSSFVRGALRHSSHGNLSEKQCPRDSLV
jgi:hypothetical protein